MSIDYYADLDIETENKKNPHTSSALLSRPSHTHAFLTFRCWRRVSTSESRTMSKAFLLRGWLYGRYSLSDLEISIGWRPISSSYPEVLPKQYWDPS